MDPIALAERSFGISERVIAGVRLEQMGEPTPCSEWDVRALVNHIIGAHLFFTAALRGEQVDPHGTAPDVAGTNPSGAFVRARDGMLAAWREPGALDRTVQTMLGAMPSSMLIGMLTMDNLVHSWDLARATGQDENLDPQLAAQMLVMMKQVNPPRSEGSPFKPEQKAPADATPEQQLAAYLGRTV